MIQTRLIFKIGIVVTVFTLFGFYSLQKSKNFLEGPKITINFPKNGAVVSSSDLEVNGVAENISLLFFNGRQIYTDEDGNFKESLLLAQGYNIIEVKGEDKFNRKIKEVRRIVLK